MAGTAVQRQHQKVLRTLMKSPGNKKCADCGEQCPVNVDVTHSIFICNQCAGVHREFGDRIKSVSMATFTSDEVQQLQGHTNEDFNRVWMSRWKPEDGSPPLNAEDHVRRDFLTRKYVEKRWFSKRAQDHQPAAAPAPVEPEGAFPARVSGNGSNPFLEQRGGSAKQAAWSPFVESQSQPQVAQSQSRPAAAPAPEVDLLSIDTPGPVPPPAPAGGSLRGLLDLMGGPPQPGFQGGYGQGPVGGGMGQPGGYAQGPVGGGMGQPGGYAQGQVGGGMGQPGGYAPAQVGGGMGQPGGFGGGYGQAGGMAPGHSGFAPGPQGGYMQGQVGGGMGQPGGFGGGYGQAGGMAPGHSGFGPGPQGGYMQGQVGGGMGQGGGYGRAGAGQGAAGASFGAPPNRPAGGDLTDLLGF